MWIGFVIVAAICSAVADSVENEHFFDTVFKSRDKSFWYKRESWNKAGQIGHYPFDAWHLAKSMMIVFLSLAVVSYENYFRWYVDLIIIGIVWSVTFNIFYNHIFKSK